MDDQEERATMIMFFFYAVMIFFKMTACCIEDNYGGHQGRKRRRISSWGGDYILRIINDESRSDVFKKLYRMYPSSFKRLCHIFRRRHLLVDTRDICVEEQLAIFLLLISQCSRYVVCMDRFERSIRTVSTYFNRVLDAILKLARDYIRQPLTRIHPNIRNDSRLYPYFENCIGAIDGTHILAHILGSEQTRFWNRKHQLTQNVMAVCNWDMEFTYVLAGWEGSAADSRILRTSILMSPGGLYLPTGKYYLVDAGYANMPGFLAPYRGVRYHMQEFDSTSLPQNPKELFNHRHSSLRTTIERTFGVLKNRWAILDRRPPFPYMTQVKLVVACCVLHNFLQMSDSNDTWDEVSPTEDVNADIDSNEEVHVARAIFSASEIDSWNNFRDDIAQKMWDDQN